MITEIMNVSAQPIKLGGMADIYEGWWKSNRVKVAIKAVRIVGTAASNKLSRRIAVEVAVWQSLQHSNILPLLGLCTWPPAARFPAMISPWCRNGNISDYLAVWTRRKSPILERMKLDLIAQIFTGVQYLHARDVVHADLKGGNVMISDHGIARVCDFGFAVILEDDPGSAIEHSVAGTWPYMAFEVNTEGRYTPQSDIWACGCLLIEIMGGEMPYNGLNYGTVVLAQSRGELPPRPIAMSNDVWALVLQCCRLAPTERVNIGSLLGQVHSLRAIARATGDTDLDNWTERVSQTARDARLNRDRCGPVKAQIQNFRTWAPAFLVALSHVCELRPIVQGLVHHVDGAIRSELKKVATGSNSHVILILVAILKLADVLFILLEPKESLPVDDAFNFTLHAVLDSAAEQVAAANAACEAYMDLPYLARLFTRTAFVKVFEEFSLAFADTREALRNMLKIREEDHADSFSFDIQQLILEVPLEAEGKLLQYIEMQGGIKNFLDPHSWNNAVRNTILGDKVRELELVDPAFQWEWLDPRYASVVREIIRTGNARTVIQMFRYTWLGAGEYIQASAVPTITLNDGDEVHIPDEPTESPKDGLPTLLPSSQTPNVISLYQHYQGKGRDSDMILFRYHSDNEVELILSDPDSESYISFVASGDSISAAREAVAREALQNLTASAGS